MSESSLALIEPQQLVRQSTDIAGLCKAIVLKSVLDIQGRKYVRVEGWQSIATAHGCLASSRTVERVDGGYRAIGEVRRMTDGAILAEAEGFVGEDEATWFGGEMETRNGTKIMPKRPDYAIRAMAQTRAISRACRSAFAHVVVLMDAGLSTTPAEEVPHGGFQDESDREKEAQANSNAPVIASHVHFGENKGVSVLDLSAKQLQFYKKNFEAQRDKGKMQSDADKALYAAVMAHLESPIETSLPGEGKEPDGDDLPMFNGEKHRILDGHLSFTGVHADHFMTVARKKGWIPDNKMTFGQMPEEMAAGFCERLEEVIAACEAGK